MWNSANTTAMAAADAGCGRERSAAHARFLGIALLLGAGPAAAFTYSMAKVKLGMKEFDVDIEEILAYKCGVTDADCAALASRMASGEISRLKILYLVSFIFFIF